MKTLKLLALLFGLFISAKTRAALGPATTYTLVNPCQPFATITPIPNTYGCFSFSATNAGANDPNAFYSWNFGDGTTATGNPVYHCYPPASSLTVAYTATVNYNSAMLCGPLPTSQTYTLLVNPPPPNFCVSGPVIFTQSQLSVTVEAFPTFPETIITHDYGDGTPPATFSYTHTYAKCGNYIIDVSYWDMNQPEEICHAYGAVNIPCPPTPTVVGIEERPAAPVRVQIFPNPASDLLKFRTGLTITGIKVADITGREWTVNSLVNGEEHTLYIAELPAGVYFLKLEPGSGTGINAKFIKD
jgi:hypothetical protein